MQLEGIAEQKSYREECSACHHDFGDHQARKPHSCPNGEGWGSKTVFTPSGKYWHGLKLTSRVDGQAE